MNKLNIKGIHHIAIIVSDYEVSKKFYTEVLGFEIIREVWRAERKSFKLDLSLEGRFMLELFTFDDSPSRPSQPEAQGLRHLAFSTSNIQESIKHLNEHGIITEEIRMDEFTQKQFTFFRDPDNLPLELYQE